jgi:hypothetical protein
MGMVDELRATPQIHIFRQFQERIPAAEPSQQAEPLDRRVEDRQSNLSHPWVRLSPGYPHLGAMILEEAHTIELFPQLSPRSRGYRRQAATTSAEDTLIAR